MPSRTSGDHLPDVEGANDSLLRLSEAIEQFRAHEDPAARGEAATTLTRAMSDGVLAAKVLARQTVLEMKSAGMTYRQIGEVMGVSGARAYEIGAGLSGGRRA